MHGDVALTPVALWAGLLLRFGVPVVCAVIIVDAARRPVDSFGRASRAVWIALGLAILVTLVVAFVLPDVIALRFFAVLALPLTLALGAAYLLAVVFRKPEAPAADS